MTRLLVVSVNYLPTLVSIISLSPLVIDPPDEFFLTIVARFVADFLII